MVQSYHLTSSDVGSFLNNFHRSFACEIKPLPTSQIKKLKLGK